MQASQPEPDAGRCLCGRSRADAAATSYVSSQGPLAFHRCQCGMEWTERLGNASLADPVTSDELIEVHQLLAQLDGPLSKLLPSA